MSGKEVLIQPNQRFLEVSHLGSFHTLEVAQSVCQLEEAKKLDDLVFGKHLGITMDELVNIMNNGAVLLLRDSNGKLIGESQVITSPIPQHSHLDEDEAYNYGTAISPELQNNGTAQILFKGQEIIAKEAGKSRSTLTVRLENAQSIRGRFKAGFHIVGYDPNYYGSVEEDGARIIMEKRLNDKKKYVFSTEELIKVVSCDDFSYAELEGISVLMKNPSIFLGVWIKNGDNIDLSGHSIIAEILGSQGYEGIGLIKENELNYLRESEHLLIFKRK